MRKPEDHGSQISGDGAMTWDGMWWAESLEGAKAEEFAALVKDLYDRAGDGLDLRPAALQIFQMGWECCEQSIDPREFSGD
jgi:hypothetical protein